MASNSGMYQWFQNEFRSDIKHNAYRYVTQHNIFDINPALTATDVSINKIAKEEYVSVTLPVREMDYIVQTMYEQEVERRMRRVNSDLDDEYQRYRTLFNLLSFDYL